MKMHPNEINTGIEVVTKLIKSQFPQWSDLPLCPVTSMGTDNTIYRLGDSMSVRLPRIDWATGQVSKEAEWLPQLAPHLPVAVPEQIAQGQPDETYPWTWSINRWLGGESADVVAVHDTAQLATDLAHFLSSLRSIDATNAPLAREHDLRGVDLAIRDNEVRAAIKQLSANLDSSIVTRTWNRALTAPRWSDTNTPVWFHGDLLPGNILIENDKLSAVIDFNGLGAGDPACDLMIAWRMFTPHDRQVFRESLGLDDATWERGKGQALAQALIYIPYYQHTNPKGTSLAYDVINTILNDD